MHVLIVNASAVARMALEEALAAAPGTRVSLAGDGAVAQARIQLDPPDVVLLDLELPRAAALDLLRWASSHTQIPVVVYASAPRSEPVLQALGAGAVAVVERPAGAEFTRDEARRLAGGLRAALRFPPRTVVPPARLSERIVRVVSTQPIRRAAMSSVIIAIGASTGGTEALAGLVPALPAGFPGGVIVQHMPAQFTRNFAERLDRLGALRVREAADGDIVEDGVLLIAPGDRHTRVRRHAGGFAIEVFDGPVVSQHRPSVDVLFHSVAAAAGPDAIGVIMTGMGADGAAGLAAMHGAGARTIGQDEASSTVYGMPRVAAELGAVDVVASLDTLPAQLIAAAERLRRRAS